MATDKQLSRPAENLETNSLARKSGTMIRNHSNISCMETTSGLRRLRAWSLRHSRRKLVDVNDPVPEGFVSTWIQRVRKRMYDSPKSGGRTGALVYS